MNRTTDPVYLAFGYALVACRVCERPLRITQGEFGWESYDGEGEPDLDEWQCAEPCEPPVKLWRIHDRDEDGNERVRWMPAR